MFSLQVLTARMGAERGSMVVEYAFIFVVVVLAAMVAASALGASVVELWTSNGERFATAVQPALEQG